MIIAIGLNGHRRNSPAAAVYIGNSMAEAMAEAQKVRANFARIEVIRNPMLHRLRLPELSPEARAAAEQRAINERHAAAEAQRLVDEENAQREAERQELARVREENARLRAEVESLKNAPKVDAGNESPAEAENADASEKPKHTRRR